MSWRNVIMVALVLLVILGAWLCRYTIIGVSPGDGIGFAYRLDRWTGKVVCIQKATGKTALIDKQ